MNERLSVPALFLAACAILAIAWASPTRAADPDDDSIILVAKRQLQDKLYGSTIVLSRPIGADRHVGFIINKPTQVSLAKLFPGHEPSKKVVDPVFLGGPVSPEVIFALVQGKQSPGGRSLKILDDLYLAIDSDVVDSVIEKQAAQARFFAGMVLWRPGELNEELKRGLWYVLDAKSDLALRKSTEGMWEELVGRSERKANSI
ncbi:MAG TPA: YqgE/AlgH family protein [Burkholderiales bacterium]|nr:YqgE/AlgH family protein [Burkholderiales bacterium]